MLYMSTRRPLGGNRFAVFRYKQTIIESHQPGVFPQISARDCTVVDRLEMARNQGGVRHGLGHFVHVLKAHNNAIQIGCNGKAGVHHDHVRFIRFQRFSDVAVPACVAGEVQRIFTGMTEDNPAYVAQTFSSDGRRFFRSVPSRRPAERYALEGGIRRQHPHVRKALRPDASGIALVLGKEWKMLGHQLNCSFVPVIALRIAVVRMGNNSQEWCSSAF